MKTMLFSYVTSGSTQTGRELLADLNKKIVREIVGDSLVEVICATQRVSGWRGRLRALAGWLDGLDRRVADECARLIEMESVAAVYIEGSNYGRLAKAVKDIHPRCKVITFFHNVESKFFLDAFKSKPSIRAAAVLLANFRAEALAVKYSDRIICLNTRDSTLLQRVYGRAATNISPLCVKDVDAPSALATVPRAGESFAIFVGGAFYANVRGIQWYAEKVAPFLRCKTYVIGKGFDEYRAQLEEHQNVTVIGAVSSVDDWYTRATVVVAPIFEGSGMKTKVAEALRYGRPVVGTAEAFVGYERDGPQVGFVCTTADDFIRRITSVVDGRASFDPSVLRLVYETSYSLAAARGYMADAFHFDANE